MVEQEKPIHQITEQQEDPNNPIFRRWHQVNFCKRIRSMRVHNMS